MTTKQPDDQAARGGEYEIKTPITTKYMERGLMIFVDDDGAIIHPQDICNAINQAAAEQRSEQPDAEVDDGCICQGNWRNIVKEYEPLFNRIYVDKDGGEWSFWGIVHANDDYYYLLTNGDRYRLGTCVGSLEGNGFTLREMAEARPSQPQPAEPLGDVCETDDYISPIIKSVPVTIKATVRGRIDPPIDDEPAPNPQAVEADVDLRTALAYEAGQRAERVRIAEELQAIYDSPMMEMKFSKAIREYIEKLRGETNGK